MIRIASAQRAFGANPAENTTFAVDAIRDAAAEGADLIVLPEASLFTSMDRPQDVVNKAESLDGAFLTAIRQEAAALRTPVLVGTFEMNPEGNPYNTVVHIDESGKVDSSYRKVHLYDAFGYRESDSITAGAFSEPLVFEQNGLTVGVITCYDLRFPESARTLVDAGANVIIVPACWVDGPRKVTQWETLLRARAIENTCWVVAANQAGPVATGNSMTIDPAGDIVARADHDSATVLAAVDLNRVQEVRSTLPALEGRRFSVVPNATRQQLDVERTGG